MVILLSLTELSNYAILSSIMTKIDSYKKISKSLSYWLRHRPDVANLKLDSQGWAKVDDVLSAMKAHHLGGQTDLDEAITHNDKQRFELSPDGALIRARQGHSVEVELDWPVTEPPAILYHGTVPKFVNAIMAEGLKPMTRHHVHLSPDMETATKVGQRRGKPTILSVDAARMHQDSKIFYLTDNGVWLTDAVAAKYLSVSLAH